MYGNTYGYYNPSRIGVPTQPIQPTLPTQMPPTYTQPTVATQMSVAPSLQGKIVESMDIVKTTEIPLDGSTSFFPLADGSAILTKKLQNDGTSRTVIYKPVIEEPKKEVNDTKWGNFVSIDDFKELKEEMEDLKEELSKLKEYKKETSKKEGK